MYNKEKKILIIWLVYVYDLYLEVFLMVDSSIVGDDVIFFIYDL